MFRFRFSEHLIRGGPQRPVKRGMLRANACLLVGLLICGFLPGSVSAGDLDGVRAQGTLKMLCWPHQESRFIRRMIEEYGEAGQNRFTGIDVTLMRGFAAELGVELEVVPAQDSFQGIFSALQAGDGDLVASSITITPARQALFDFSVPYFQERMVIVAKKSSGIGSPEDLAHKKGAVVLGSSHDQRLRQLSPEGLAVVGVDYPPEALQKVKAGEADFALVDSGTIGSAKRKSQEAVQELEVVFTFDDAESYGVGVRKGSDLLPLLNAYLQRIRGSGELERVIESHP